MEYLCLILTVFLIAAIIKIFIMKKSAKEVSSQLSEKIHTDTNTLITISSFDKDIRKLAAELNILIKEMNEQKLRYTQGDKALKENVTNISHDIRTPLTAISGYLELLKKENNSPQARRWLEIISERTDAIKNMTNEMLTYAVSVSEKHDILLENVIINDILEETISSFYGAITERKITPEINICEKKIHRKLNRNALKRIFANIISNAIKYSDGDLKIILNENGNISFSNHASELDEITVNRLFQRFYTVENAGKSTGLGLSIAKALTEQMNGKIRIHYSQKQIFIDIDF